MMLKSTDAQYRFLMEQQYKHTLEMECRCGAVFIYTKARMDMGLPTRLPNSCDFTTMMCFCGSRLPFNSDAELIAAVPYERRSRA